MYRARNIKIICFDGSIVKYYLHSLHIFKIVNNKLKENTFVITRSENLTTWPSCRHFVLSTFILSISTSLPFFLSSEFQWVSFHQQNFFTQSYAIFRQKLCDFEIHWTEVVLVHPFFGRYVILLLEWWKEYKAISSSIRVGQDDFLISICDGRTLPTTETPYFFGRHVTLYLYGEEI